MSVTTCRRFRDHCSERLTYRRIDVQLIDLLSEFIVTNGIFFHLYLTFNNNLFYHIKQPGHDLNPALLASKNAIYDKLTVYAPTIDEQACSTNVETGVIVVWFTLHDYNAVRDNIIARDLRLLWHPEQENNIEIYSAEKAASWTLRFVQLADDLNLPNAGSALDRTVVGELKTTANAIS